MTRENLEQLASLNTPHISIKCIGASSTDNFTARLNGQAHELHRCRTRERTEVSIANQIICANCSIQTCTKENLALFCELDARHRRRVVGESHSAEARECVPNLDFAIIAASNGNLSILCISNRVHIEKVALLLKNVRLTRPFPYKQLAQTLRAECEPLASTVDGHTRDFFLANTQSMNLREVRHVSQ